MLVRDWRGQEGDAHDGDTGDTKQDDAEVQEVDSTYDGGTVTGVSAAAGSINKLGDHPGQTDRQPNHEAIKCTLREEGKKKKKHSSDLDAVKLLWWGAMVVLRMRRP